MRITSIRAEADATQTQISATLVPGEGTQRLPLWFRINKAALTLPAALGDSFAVGLLIPCMHEGEDLHIEGPITAGALDAIARVQSQMSSWHSDLAQIEVKADEVVAPTLLVDENAHAKLPTAAFFSGGVDSWYTLLSTRDTLSDLILVHGFDIRLTNQRLWGEAARQVERVANAFGLGLICVSTNLRQVADRSIAPWGSRFERGTFWSERFFGSALAAVGATLQAELGRIVIASGYESLRPELPWGSHPLLDPLWSTPMLQLVHDTPVPRLEKIRRIAEEPLALETLRVCTRGDKTGLYNCCRCEKCLRTMLGLHFCGSLNRASAFPSSLDYAAIKRIQMRNRMREAYAELENVARSRGERRILVALEVASGKRFSVYRVLHTAGRFLRRKAIPAIVRRLPEPVRGVLRTIYHRGGRRGRTARQHQP